MAWPKSSSASRGYGAPWRALREKVLRRDGYVCVCENCKRANRVLEATHVDHIVSKARWQETHGNLDGVDDPSNLQSMNVDCHNLKSALEKGIRPQMGCDRNGWPTDPNHPWNRK
jgi:5-methylcytosine-specific restriction protein A